MSYKYLKNFYQAYYPDDSVGEEIRTKATFNGLFENIQNCYRYIGVLDSVIRERLFAQLAKIKGVDYEEIYNLYFKGR